MERAQLSAARHRKHWSLEEAAACLGVDKATLQRWEKGKSTPQAVNLRKLCEMYEMTAWELGLEEVHSVVTQNTTLADQGDDALASFRREDLTLRLLHIVWNWLPNNARYQMLQSLIMLELEDNSMNDEISRRNALRFLALVPIDMLGLSQFSAVFKSSYEDILKYCAAGITACWYLRKGKELVFADQAVSKYIPTLKAIVQAAPERQRKAAADLLAQCFLLKAPLAWNLTTTNGAILYAQQAEAYGVIAGSRLLQVAALRTTAATFCYANQWKQALQAAEKAKYWLELKEKSTPSQPAEEPIPQLVSSYVYAGLATYRAYSGRKEDALYALKKAHKAFFERPTNEQVPIWIDHNIGNLLINDGETCMHLGLYKEAIRSLEQINTQYAQDITISLTGRVNSLIKQVMAEVSRDDKPRDLQWCMDRWMQGINEAKALQSQQHFNEAIQTYTALRAAWPAEKRIKDLREYIVHW